MRKNVRNLIRMPIVILIAMAFVMPVTALTAEEKEEILAEEEIQKDQGISVEEEPVEEDPVEEEPVEEPVVEDPVEEEPVEEEKPVEEEPVKEKPTPELDKELVKEEPTPGPEESKLDISDVIMATSIPVDVEIGFGWEKFSCLVESEKPVSDVKLILEKDGLTEEFAMLNIQATNINDSDKYTRQITILEPGDYTYKIQAEDADGNMVESEPESFYLPANWDLDGSGDFSFMDIVQMMTNYGKIGEPGWIRADINNDGKVHFIDLMSLFMHYE